jgi:Kae1-associated kinase Bud32
MAIEVTERALAHTGKNEVLLAGGVGANSRLREMLDDMCCARGAKFYVPEKRFMGDNGAMIAYTGLLMFKAGDILSIEDSFVDACFRPDDVSVTWKPEKQIRKDEEIDKMKNGAEAVIHIESKKYGFESSFKIVDDETEEMIVKERIQKSYRLPQIDSKIRKERTRTEVRMLTEARRCGVSVPIIYGVDAFSIQMERIKGTPLKFVIDDIETLAEMVGIVVGKLHENNIIHGDLTTSNMIYGADEKLYMIDFGLSYSDSGIESKGVDVHVLFQTFDSSHKNPALLKELFSKGYRESCKEADGILKRAEEIKMRGRYIEGS